MSGKLSLRGIIWILVGIAVLFVGYAMHRPFVLRGTSVPFWLIVVALGVILLIYDAVKARRSAQDRGDPPTPPP